MERINQAGIEKKSFELAYHGGQIWCEHLDGMGMYEEEVLTKFLKDEKTFSRPSVSSFMIMNLDQTVITERIADTIVQVVLNCDKQFGKIAFVGVSSRWKMQFGCIKQKGILIHFFADYEKAKEWLFS